MTHRTDSVVRRTLSPARLAFALALAFGAQACSCAVGRPDESGDAAVDVPVVPTDGGHDSGSDGGFDAGDSGPPPNPCGDGLIDSEAGEVCDPNADPSLSPELRCMCPDDGNNCTGDTWVDDPTAGQCYGSCEHPTLSGFEITNCMNPDLPCHQYTLAGDITTCTITCTDITATVDDDCDDVDDDCDGTADDDYANPACTVPGGKLGPCAAGYGVCTAGVETCPQIVFSGTEVCNNVDDDCNGTVDNNVASSVCSVPNTMGPCAVGMSQCISGNTTCPQSVFPNLETCNNVDDNCNGTLDEGVPSTPCAVAGKQGACGVSSTQCIAGANLCPQTVFPTSEVCNAVDDDCNGTVNNGNPGGGGLCATGIPGPCGTGVFTCGANDTALVCTQTTFATAEICAADGGIGPGDGVDNDCNGSVDTNPTVNDGNPNSCGAAGNRSVAVGVGGMVVVPGVVDVNGFDYFLVQFQGVTSGSAAFHPKFVMTSANNAYTFSLFTSTTCATPTPSGGCGASGANNYTTWEMNYPGDQLACSSSAGNDGTTSKCSDTQPRQTSIVVRVQRNPLTPTINCGSYSIAITN